MSISNEKYDWDKILEMFGGYSYFSKNHLLFVYHDVNGRTDEAAKYKEILDEEHEQIKSAVAKLKANISEEEVNTKSDDE